jgi:hypothetical protein
MVDVVGFAFLWFDERIREVCSRYARFTSGILPCGGANCIELGYLVSAKAIAVGQKSQIVGHAWLVWVDGFVLLFLHPARDAIGQRDRDSLSIAHPNYFGGRGFG